ncbi:MAG: radical SAM protein [Myxococcales bacterium]|nr:radical SAM protein [Myxococcales bacterium]
MRLLSVEQLLRRGLDRLAPASQAASEPKPQRIFWWWEQICNLACNHCDIGHRTESYRLKPALDLAQKREIVSKLSTWLGPGYSLSLIAGEPFLHRDIFDVLGFASEQGAVTSLTTNGTLIATKNRARQVVDSGLGFMAVSLDSLDPKLHDETRGKPGTWAQAMKAIEYVREAREARGAKRPVVYVNSIVMRGNHDELLRLSDWCRDNQIEGHTFQPIATTDFFQGKEHQGDHWFQKSELWPDPKETLALVDELERRRAQGYPIKNTEADFDAWRTYFRDPTELAKEASCEGELKTLLVTETGQVKMCPNTPEDFGSILKHDLDWLWSSPAASRARKHVYECDSQCKILANNKEDFYF